MKEWADAYGFEAAEKICRIHLIPPKQTLRVNQMKADRAELLDLVLRTLKWRTRL